MRIIAILFFFGCTGEISSETVQALCTIEDQQSGACPPTSQIVDEAVSYTADHHGSDLVMSWANCWRDASGWRCTVKADFSWGYVLTTCADTWCYSTTHPSS